MRKNIYAMLAVAAFTATSTFATGPIGFSTYDANNFGGAPLYLDTVGNFAPASGTFVQLLVGGSPVSVGGNSILQLSSGSSGYDSGLFDFGTVHTGLADNSSQSFQLLAWRGTSDYATRTHEATVSWTQSVGASATSGPPPTPEVSAVLTLGGNGVTPHILLVAVPEPTTIGLGVLGGLALLARRRRE